MCCLIDDGSGYVPVDIADFKSVGGCLSVLTVVRFLTLPLLKIDRDDGECSHQVGELDNSAIYG
jgi:hypothetical protein